MKSKRHGKILELINEYEIETQEELATRLVDAGFTVTQATISRDIRELKLSKMATRTGKQKYIALVSRERDMTDKYTRVLRDGFISSHTATNIIVIKTVIGMAMAVATAIDSLELDGIVGCIAGDDTIMCAIRSNEDTQYVMEQVEKLIKKS